MQSWIPEESQVGSNNGNPMICDTSGVEQTDYVIPATNLQSLRDWFGSILNVLVLSIKKFRDTRL